MYLVSNGERKEWYRVARWQTYQVITGRLEYKYLGVLEVDKFLEEKIKSNVSKEYIRRLRKVLKSKLNGGDLVRGVNIWAVYLLRHSAAFVNWRKSELQAIDRKTKKLFIIYGALHPKSIYLEKKETEV